MDLICVLLLLFEFAFLVRIALSFFPLADGSKPAVARDIASAVTDPVIVPLRRSLPPMPGVVGRFGSAELLVLIVVQVLVAVVC